MGYYSDVTILVYGPEDAVTAFLAAQRLRGRNPLEVGGDHLTLSRLPDSCADSVEGGSPWLLLRAEFTCVKWYEHYPEVRLWENLLSDADDASAEADYSGGVCYEYIRAGEDPGDVEYRFSSHSEHFLTARTVVECGAPTGELINLK